MRVVIDPEVCQGHLRCYAIAPDLFEIDELGHAISPDVEFEDGPDLERARLAVASCPEHAIRIEG